MFGTYLVQTLQSCLIIADKQIIALVSCHLDIYHVWNQIIITQMCVTVYIQIFRSFLIATTVKFPFYQSQFIILCSNLSLYKTRINKPVYSYQENMQLNSQEKICLIFEKCYNLLPQKHQSFMPRTYKELLLFY